MSEHSKVRLKEYEAGRSKNITDSVVRNIIMQKIAEGPLPLLGYRSWWNMLRKSYRLKVSRDKVMKILREINPVATEARQAHKFNTKKLQV